MSCSERRRSQHSFVIFPALFLGLAVIAPACSRSGGGGNDGTISAAGLRDRVESVVGDLEKLRVPADDASLPQPAGPDGRPDSRFAITEAKRVLGQQLFFDPVRANAIRPEFGGVLSTAQTASCGSCHLGEAAGKAGQTMNLAVGAAGRGYRDSLGILRFDRTIVAGLVDTIPTPIERIENDEVVMSGRFDAVDAVARLSPSMIGFGFNNRLLLGGKAGQRPGEGPGADNPRDLPAAENLAEIAFGAHRMLETQADALQAIPAYVRLFSEAFPAEAAEGDLDTLVNDRTAARAVAAFLRTVVTRNTPWDRFLAGDDEALTKAQRRGAELFVTPASGGGAGCISCHSGPMLNKQLGDEEGLLVEENFHNLGVGDHPLRELARRALGDPDHHDTGRGEITGLPGDQFEFRTLTLRQLKDGRQFMHDALFTSVRQVVEYFNAGVPADPVAAAAGNVSERFTHPRGPGSAPGLGLSDSQVTDLVDFLENALFDGGFVLDTPGTPTTRTFEPNARDLAYSENRPDLAALGAIDGFMASGLSVSNEDPITRLDRGVEVRDVTALVSFDRGRTSISRGRQVDEVFVTNISATDARSPLGVVVENLPPGARLVGSDGTTIENPAPGLPYRRLPMDSGWFKSGETARIVLEIESDAVPIAYALRVYSGERRP